MSTIKNTLNNLIGSLQDVSSSPQLDACILLEEATDMSRTSLFTQGRRHLSSGEETRLQQLIWQRRHHYPISYLTGTVEFYGRAFRITEGVLSPRPETEHLVEHAKQYITSLPTNAHILEIGTGTGCVSVTLADEFLHTYSFEATDNDAYALHLAHFNAKLHNVEDNIRLVRRDLLRKGPYRSPHVIIANLPYLDVERHSDDSIKKEPASHLYSSAHGRGHYRRLFRELSRLSSFRECPLFGEALPEDMEALQNEAKRIWGDTGEFEQCDSFVFKLNVRA